MGTRGTFGFVVAGVAKTVYNHSDSYPEGLGVEVLRGWQEMRKTWTAEEIITKLTEWRAVKRGQKPTKKDIARCQKLGIVNLDVSNRSTDDWYCLLRGAQGDMVKTLAAGVFEDSSSFLKDSLFCEWAYLINFDTLKLEVYAGFNHGVEKAGKIVPEHPFGRYAAEMDEENKAKLGTEESPSSIYFGVYLVAEFPLQNLPSEAEFVKKVTKAQSSIEKGRGKPLLVADKPKKAKLLKA